MASRVLNEAHTPARFGIGKVVRDFKERCDAILIRISRTTKRDDRSAFCGPRGAVDGGIVSRALGPAKATISRGAAAERLPSGWILAVRSTPPEPINCAGGVKRILEREAALRLFVGDRLAEGWTPEQISGNELRPAGDRLRDHLRLPTSSDRTQGRRPYASWQKGGVENANGKRLRRWLPRHLDIDQTSDQEIQEIVLTTNLTPRKCLRFKTPFQALIAELGKDVQIRFS